jgi:cellobiose phosphorylase
VTRRFRGATYHIEFLNPVHRSKGAWEITVDGNRLETNIVPVFPEGTEHIVKVII